jgi:hypothetical protein
MIGAPAHCVEENYLIVQISYSLEKRGVKTVPKPEELPDRMVLPIARWLTFFAKIEVAK